MGRTLNQGKCDVFLSKSDYTFLRLKSPPEYPKTGPKIRNADLFCGCGGLSLGAKEACRILGMSFEPVFAVDIDQNAAKVYEKNFSPKSMRQEDIAKLVDGEIGAPLTKVEKNLIKEIGPIDILLAGPPCQGYSSLNNYPRQNDHRNSLYERVTRFIEISRPRHILIENVPTVIHSKIKVVETTNTLLNELGYNHDDAVIDLSEIGVPQIRNRHVVAASLDKNIEIDKIVDANKVLEKRSVTWAISGISDESPLANFDKPTNHSINNMDRILYLHREQIYDLPDFKRPECHRLKKHGYKSMYGRLKPNEPAQTITSGFLSPGQGRFIHPTKPRTITPHEAARLQFFPDFFDFSDAKTRRSFALLIGNAAPMKLAFVFSLHFFT